MRLFLSILVFAVLLTNCNTPPPPPNIILIMADDLGYETIGANGGTSYQTPVLDAMADKGIRFNHCYAQPLCTPSRIKIMTGISNMRNYTDFGVLDESQTTFGHLFREAGYATAVVGKWQLGTTPDGPEKAGFDQHCLWQVTPGATDSTGRDTRYSKPLLQIDGRLERFKESEYAPEIATQYALDFMEEQSGHNKPFLLYYPMILTHCPFSPTPNSPEWTTDDTTVMRYKGKAHYFEDMVTVMDSLVGVIQRKLKELNIEDNTLLIFTGDNGTDRPIVSMLNGREVAGAKRATTDAGTRVPLIAQWPGVIQDKVVNNDLIDFSDFLPTICEATGIKIPDSLRIDGKSFFPQLQGETGQPRDWIYCWFARNPSIHEPRIFVRNQRYKLYTSGEFFDVPNDWDEQNPLNIEELDGDTKQTWQMFKEVLNHYNTRRLECIPEKTYEN